MKHSRQPHPTQTASKPQLPDARKPSRCRVWAWGCVALAVVTGDPANAVNGGRHSSPGFIHQIAVDFVNVLTTPENLWVAAGGLGVAWGAHQFDDDIATSRFNSELHETSSYDRYFEAGHVLGTAYVQTGGAVATYALGKGFAHPGVARLGRDLLRAQAITQSLTFGIKVAVGRERPDGSNKLSFPSGHSSTSFASAAVLQRRHGWKAGVPAYAVAGYIAVSRLNEARHYLSDVVFGAAIGVLVGRTVTADAGQPDFAVRAVPIAAGSAIQLTWAH